MWHALQDDGLQTFYSLRGGDGVPVGDEVTRHRTWTPDVTDAGDGSVYATVGVDGVHCAGCVWLVERMPQVVDGVVDARLNLGRGRMEVRWSPDQVEFGDIDSWLSRFGYSPYPLDVGRGEAQEHREREALVKVGVSWALAANVMLLTVAMYGGLDASDGGLWQGARWLSLLLAGGSMAYGGREFFRRAWASFRPFRGIFELGVDVPVSIGLIAGFAFSAFNTIIGTGEVWFDSVAVLIAALLTARWLHARGLRQAADATNRLSAIVPQLARRLLGDGTTEQVATGELDAGDLVEVRTGDVVPADGVVVDGLSAVDRALLTGESAPEATTIGDAVWAGETVVRGSLRLQVEKTGDETRFGQLVRWVLDAEDHKAATVALADRLAGWFVVAILIGAVVTAVVAAMTVPEDVVPRVIALLVVSCPCALGMATPLAFSIAVGRAARRGLFVRHDGVFETIQKIDAIVLDKTGTITSGAMRVIDVAGDREVLRLAAAAERRSDHPVARAFAAYDDGCEATDYDELVGHGVRALVDGALIEVHGADGAANTTVAIAVDGVERALVTIGDTLRPDAAALISSWQRHGVDVWIASGDHQAVVENIAEQVGVMPDRTRARQSPEDKLHLIEQLRSEGRIVAMVGDGVNDAAALREADVGIAMFGGADINAVAADVQLGRGGLQPVAELDAIATDALRAVRRNLTLSAIYNVLALAAAGVGLITPLAAAIAMPLSSIAVVVSSLAQGRGRATPRSGETPSTSRVAARGLS